MELQISVSPSNEYSELISFMIGWFDLLADQGTLKSLLQDSTNLVSVFTVTSSDFKSETSWDLDVPQLHIDYFVLKLLKNLSMQEEYILLSVSLNVGNSSVQFSSVAQSCPTL